jgi:Putative DNA-binding domain
MSGASPVATALAGLQREFLARMRGESESGLDALIASRRMPRDVGLNIYAHAYNARLREALDNDHAALGAYLGDELWDRMCDGYIATHPSRYRSLRDFGVQLPDYLAQAEPFCAHPQIAELALFERRLLDSFDAADDKRVGWEQLLALPPAAWPTLRLRFHPSLRLHRVTLNSVEIWQAIKSGSEPPAVTTAMSTHWALWRDVERVNRFRSLNAQESDIVAHCMQGGDFAGLCELLATWHPAEAVPMAALEHLRMWCKESWISHWDVQLSQP